MDVKLQTLLGKNIRKLRLADGLTLEELSFRAQVHPNYLGDIERGKRNLSLSNLKKIADGLKRPPAELLNIAHLPPAHPSKPARVAVYFPTGQDTDILSLVHLLRKLSPKNRKHVIQIAKSLGAKLRRD